ncbi:hypothetical protein MY04_3466 [Flammeovirga sp. MY04]|uniref:glycosyltransferase family 39 protein n=1 Tax=Flammeovirga sp. MY04 TaxID=1191459 RepID=UPI00080612B0|nr:glycosyltransferase family 39 protein [Flammeovirga sp. MY04]ANQ50819.1 hypothetical protein MY04_3466 [Flammeovirga sp. MY04]
MRLLNSIQKKSYHYPLLFILWLITHGILWQSIGPKLGADSRFFFYLSDDILNHQMTFDRSVWYLTYGIFITFFRLFTQKIEAIVVGQLALNFLSGVCLYQIIKKYSDHSTIAFLGTFAYLFFPISLEWNYIIYSESLFTSLSIITFYFFTRKKYWKFTFLFLLTFFTRPNGIVLLSALVIAYFLELYQSKKIKRSYIIGISSIGFLLLLIILNRMMSFYGPLMIEGYLIAEIIYPKYTYFIQPIDTPFLISKDHNILLQLIGFSLGNLWYSIQLFTIKSMFFWGHIKPYYSTLHNLLIVVTLYPLYFISVFGIRQINKWDLLLRSFVLFILFQGLVVGLTSENWDGRFLPPLLPYLIILGCLGLKKYPTLSK